MALRGMASNDFETNFLFEIRIVIIYVVYYTIWFMSGMLCVIYKLDLKNKIEALYKNTSCHRIEIATAEYCGSHWFLHSLIDGLCGFVDGIEAVFNSQRGLLEKPCERTVGRGDVGIGYIAV